MATVFLHLCFCAFFIANAAGDELIFVHVVWRHGDRAPMNSFKNNPNQEDKWPMGYGELTVRGMTRQVALGKLLRKEYIDSGFLSKKLQRGEIYVRSTDRNRTIISAMSNMIGMYFNNESKPEAGVEVPSDDTPWPSGFLPIAIHTIDPKTDYLLDPLTPCPRQDFLWSQAKLSPEFRELEKEHQELLRKLTNITGEEVTLDNIWNKYDVFFNERLNNIPSLLDNDNATYEEMCYVKFVVDVMEDGLNVSSVNGINFRVEIPKIRGGVLLWTIIDQIDLKLFCLDPASENKSECKWMSALKYSVFSAHDNTITALLATLSAREKVVPLGYPDYGAALVIETWRLTNSSIVLRVRFHQDSESEGFRVITQSIGGCEQYEYCPLEIIRESAKQFYAGDASLLCTDTTSASTNMYEPWPTSPTPTEPGLSPRFTPSLFLLATVMGFQFCISR